MKSFRRIISLALFASTASLLPAAPLYWDAAGSGGANLGGTGNWDTSSALWFNGSSDVAWINANNDDAYFSGTGGTVTLAQSINAGDLYFTNLTSSVVISGTQPLVLANGIVDTGATTNTISAPLTGSAALIKNGDGTLILNAANTGFTGPVTVNQGALEAMTIGSVGTGTIRVTNNATLQYASGGAIANPFVLSGNGVTNGGALLVSGASTNTGAVTLESTNTVIGASAGIIFDMEGGLAAAGSINANVALIGGATFKLSEYSTAKTVNLHAGSLTLNGGSLNVEATSLTYSNLVLNGGQLSSSLSDKTFGTAPSAFNANNITISNGANILLSHTFTIGSTRGIYVGPGSALMGENTGSGQVTIPGAISGPGGLLFETDGSGSSFKLTGNNTYAGQTTVQTGVGLLIGSGGSTGTFGTGNTVDNGSVTVNRTGSFSYAGGISGAGSLSVQSGVSSTVLMSGPLSMSGALSLAGAGTIIFAGSNSYSASTVVNCQYFLVDNTNGSGSGTGTLTVGTSTGGSFLGGTGIISGPVTIVAGNTLQPGNPVNNTIGMLAISNTLTLQAGSASILNIDATAPANCGVVGMTSVTYGGTLTVNLLNGTLAAGQNYRLFGAGSYSGQFESGIQLPSLPSGLSWNTNNFYVNGTISVAGQNGVFNPPVISGNSLILSGTSGVPNGNFNVLSTTNLTLPIASWTVGPTGTFDNNGNFSITNTIDPTVPQEFFMIQQP